MSDETKATIEIIEHYWQKGGFYNDIPVEIMNTIINELEEKDKEIKKLNDKIEDDKMIIDGNWGCIDNLRKDYNAQKKEIERLNDIINELEKHLKKRIDFYKQEIKEFQDDLFTSNYEEIELAKHEIKIRRCHIIELEDILDKTEELKESNKE